jgi:hypothetical protein
MLLMSRKAESLTSDHVFHAGNDGSNAISPFGDTVSEVKKTKKKSMRRERICMYVDMHECR